MFVVDTLESLVDTLESREIPPSPHFVCLVEMAKDTMFSPLSLRYITLGRTSPSWRPCHRSLEVATKSERCSIGIQATALPSSSKMETSNPLSFFLQIFTSTIWKKNKYSDVTFQVVLKSSLLMHRGCDVIWCDVLQGIWCCLPAVEDPDHRQLCRSKVVQSDTKSYGKWVGKG